MEFYSEAKQSEINKSYNSAATLYFKAIVVAIDYIIFLEKSIIPKNHTQRFEILKKEYPKASKSVLQKAQYEQKKFKCKS